MSIDWEIEEGHHEFDKRNGSVTCSIYPGGVDVDLHGEFTYQDIKQILAKMKELQSEVKVKKEMPPPLFDKLLEDSVTEFGDLYKELSK